MKITNWIVIIVIVVGMLFVGRYIGAKETSAQTDNHDSLSDVLSASMYEAGLTSSWRMEDNKTAVKFITEFERNIAASLGYDLSDEAQLLALRMRCPTVAVCGDTGYTLIYTSLNRSVRGNEFVRTITPVYRFTKTYGGGYTVKLSFSGYVQVTNSVTGDSTEGSYDSVYLELQQPSYINFMRSRQEYDTEVRRVAAEMISSDFTNIVHEHSYGKDSNDRYTFEVPFSETYFAREITSRTAIAMYQGASMYVSDGTVNIYSFAAAELQKTHSYCVTEDMIYHLEGCPYIGGRSTVITGTKDRCAGFGATACPHCISGTN